MGMRRVLLGRRALWLRAASAAGLFVGGLMRAIPGAGGALLVSFGAGMIYRPLFLIAIGAFLLVLDRRVP